YEQAKRLLKLQGFVSSPSQSTKKVGKNVDYDMSLAYLHVSCITHVGGDMYDCVPQGGVIFMKVTSITQVSVLKCIGITILLTNETSQWLIGNVGDDQDSKLLKNYYNALPDDRKVILIEAILSFLSDIRATMKVTLGIQASLL
ncbi:hypothetical protein Tco_1083958, partial [Tanacetum coccineum]